MQARHILNEASILYIVSTALGWLDVMFAQAKQFFCSSLFWVRLVEANQIFLVLSFTHHHLKSPGIQMLEPPLPPFTISVYF